MKRMAIAVMLALSSVGCTSVGPYIKSIKSTGAGTLTVEKCKIEFNGIFWFIHEKECDSQIILTK